MIRNSSQESDFAVRSTTRATKTSANEKWQSGTDEMPVGLMQALERGRNVTQSGLEPVKSSTVAKIAQRELGQNVKTSIGSAPSSVSMISPSMSLIDESAQCMFSVMGALEDRAKRGDVEAVRAACECAKQVTQLMRLKLDVLKFEKE